MKKIFCFVAVIAILSVMTFSVSLPAIAEESGNQFHTSDSSLFNEIDSFSELNYGFYWVSEGNVYTKANPDGENALYNPDKPTVIFIHGYQADSGYYNRETMACYDYSWVDNGDSAFLADHWIDGGYNVLMYHWNQICDDAMPFYSETKIWAKDGMMGLRWRKNDGSYTTLDDPSNPDKPIAMSFVEDYLKLMANNNGQEIRLTGHSMGGMFSIAAMGMMYDLYQEGEIDSSIIPVRMSLMDPYFGVGYMTNLKKQITIEWKSEDDPYKTIPMYKLAMVCKDYVKKLHSIGVAIDYYKGTGTGELGVLDDMYGAEDFSIIPYVAMTEYLNSLGTDMDLGLKHCAVRDFYLYSINFPEVADVMHNGNYAITAFTPTSAVYAASGNCYVSTFINSTLSPEDDNIIQCLDDFSTPYAGIGKISGFVFEDTNCNGLRDEGPTTGLEEVSVELYKEDGTLIAETTTNEIGVYNFDSLVAGNYYILVGKASGHNYTLAYSGNDNIDYASVTDEDGRANFTVTYDYQNIVLNSGQISRDSLSRGLIVMYFVFGLFLIGGLTILLFFRTNKKVKADAEEKTGGEYEESKGYNYYLFTFYGHNRFLGLRAKYTKT